MTHATTAETPRSTCRRAQKLEILGAILLAMFLFALDQTVVGVALPRIVSDLKAATSSTPGRSRSTC